MNIEAQPLIRLTQLFLGIGIAIQAVDILLTRASLSKLCAGNRPFAFSEQWLTAKMVMQLMLAAPLILGFGKYLAVIEPVFFLALIISAAGLVLRFNGPISGGSDTMTFQVLIGMLLVSLSVVDPILMRLGFGWIAAQSILSYLLAGIAKLRNANWRDGVAVQNLLASDHPYAIPDKARAMAKSRPLCKSLGWLVIGFEVTFPAVLFLPMEGKIVMLSAGLVFHIANAALLGLNRFIWAWAATYPALLYFDLKA